MARELVNAADTYALDPNMTDDDHWRFWAPKAPARGFVAESGSRVVGMFVIRPNQQGPGSHVANGAYAVSENARGRGVGRAMAEFSLDAARSMGFHAMQFNIVVSTNVAAIRLWESIGFQIIGTVNDGFRSPEGEFVDFHIMHRML